MKTTIVATQHAKILIAYVPESVDELMPLLANFNDYASEYKLINATKRKKEFLSVRILMNILIGKSVFMTYDTNRKPYLTLSGTSISVSHSGDYVAIMAAEKGVAGIDIECRTTRVGRVCERYLDPIEQSFLNDPADTSALEIAWSAKEALYKCIGKEAYNFHTLKLSPFKMASEGSLEAEFKPTGQRFDLEYVQNEAYTLVYCN